MLEEDSSPPGACNPRRRRDRIVDHFRLWPILLQKSIFADDKDELASLSYHGVIAQNVIAAANGDACGCCECRCF